MAAIATLWLLLASCTEEKSLDLASGFQLDAGDAGPDASGDFDATVTTDATGGGDHDANTLDTPDSEPPVDVSGDPLREPEDSTLSDVIADAGDSGRPDSGDLASDDGGDTGSGEIVRFVVFGDWGIYLISRIHEAADAMWTVCQSQGCDFAIGVGDNFYDFGISGLDDPQLVTKFEEPFSDWDIPLYMSLGNHDYGGDVDAQVAYSDEHDYWTMPARWYELEAGPVHFAAFDTNRVTGAQSNALLDGILTTDRTWRIGFGHHPMRSNGAHGDTGGGPRELLEWTLCDVADVYLAGHDHDLEHLDPECGVDLIVSGAVTTTRDVGEGDNTQFITSERGFAWLEVSDTRLRLEMWDLEGNVLYSWERGPPDRSVRCASDDICEPDCAEDPDCAGLDCSGDGACDDRCAFDPDCYRACPCDYNVGICEPIENPSLVACGCDPACRGGRSPCVGDGHCDSWCPTGTDPDCD